MLSSLERVGAGQKVGNLLVAIRLAVIAAGVMTVASAETLDSLRAKRARLEQELAGVNGNIQKLEALQVGATYADDYFIKEFGTWHFDSAGGVEPYFVFRKPEKALAVKYISIQLKPYNADGAIVYQAGNAVAKKVSFIGPFERVRAEKQSWWEPVRYDSGVRCLKVSSVSIAFVNGKTVSYSGKTLKKVFAPEVKNECQSPKTPL